MKSRHEIKLALAERRLPKDVRAFREAAAKHAISRRDTWALRGAQKASGVSHLLKVARGRTNIVELGTDSGWTTAAFVLADPDCTVTTFDIVDRPHREEYWALLSSEQRARITFEGLDGVQAADRVADVDCLFIGSSHHREPTVAEFNAWRPRLHSGALVVFENYRHPDYAGVEEAIGELGLQGTARAGHFVWTAP